VRKRVKIVEVRMNAADEILVETSKRLVPADPALVVREWLLAYLTSWKLSSFEVLLSICRASPRSSSELQVRKHKTTRNSITSSPETSRIDLDTGPICAKPQPFDKCTLDVAGWSYTGISLRAMDPPRDFRVPIGQLSLSLPHANILHSVTNFSYMRFIG